MIRTTWLLVLVPAMLGAQYSYYLTDATPPTPANWMNNGNLSGSAAGVTGTGNGSLISTVAVPDGTSDYELRGVVNIGSAGGSYIFFTRATSDAVLGSAGTYYAVEFRDINLASGCSANAVITRRSGGTITLLQTQAFVCRSGMLVRIVQRDTRMMVFIDHFFIKATIDDAVIPAGRAGVGVFGLASGSGISDIRIGQLDRAAPTMPAANTLQTYPQPNSVEMQWPGGTDGPNGIGVFQYRIFRSPGTPGVATPRLGPNFVDNTVSPDTTYQYAVQNCDYHFNCSAAVSFNVRTPPPNSIDPRRVGVHPHGAYWGAAGEQIDTRSGNVNYSLPLFRAMGRGGWSVPFGLSINTQLWRQDDAATWELGRDTGFGYGWRLSPGSILPVWKDLFNINHYTFIDASGAEYRLDVNLNNSNIWTSRAGTYIEYDATQQRLYFPDGSFWVMGALSVGLEEDAGVRYPTVMQDTNGNRVLVRYQNGVNSVFPNSSSRITAVEDVRAVQQLDQSYATWVFTYINGRLSKIENQIQTAEDYDFAYTAGVTLQSPFAAQPFSTTSLLTSVTNPKLSVSHNFEYNASGTGELAKVTLPFGASISWSLRNFVYSGNRTYRGVDQRFFAKAPAATPDVHAFLPVFSPGAELTASSCMSGLTAPGRKCWFFDAVQGTYRSGLVTGYGEYQAANGNATVMSDFTWTQDAQARPYISAVNQTLEPGTSAAVQSRTEQVLDDRGNVTQTRVFGFGATPVLARTYTNTYLNSPAYTSRRIWNRLSQSSVLEGGQPLTLVTNTYDGGALTNVTGLRQHDSNNYGTGLTVRGNVSSSASPGTSSSTTYDITGTPVTVTDGNGVTVSIASASGTNNAAPGIITPAGRPDLATSASYNLWLGVTGVTKPNAQTEAYTYDSAGRPASYKPPFGSPVLTYYSYDTANRTQTATVGNNCGGVPGCGRKTVTTFDGIGRPVRVQQYDSAGTLFSTVDTEYAACACSPLGKVKQVSAPYAPGQSPVWTTYSYDGLGRTVAVTPPGGGSVTTAYLANATTVTDASGKWKRSIVDVFGNLSRVEEPNPDGSQNHFVTVYAYNSVNKLTSVGMTRPAVAGGNATQTRTFQYDNQMRLTTVTTPENGTVTYGYNADNTLASRTDAKNQRITYTYDSLKRVLNVNRFKAGAPTRDECQSLDLFWDSDAFAQSIGYSSSSFAGRITAIRWGLPNTTTQSGQPTCRDGQFVELYAYNNAGQIVSKGLSIARNDTPDAATPVIGRIVGFWAYDGEGRLTDESHPFDMTNLFQPFTFTPPQYRYQFDLMGRPGRLQRATGTSPVVYVDVVNNVTYGTAGQLAGLTYDGNIESRTYNSRLQLTKLQVTGPQAMDLEYQFSATQNDGRLQTVRNLLPGGETVNYQYDTLGRLSRAENAASGGWGQTYSYDGFGNLLKKAIVGGSSTLLDVTVDPLTNRINSSGYAYDANGNLTTIGGQQFTYDVENRLEGHTYSPKNERIVNGNKPANVVFYSPDGRRLSEYETQIIGNPGFRRFVFNQTTASHNLWFAGKMLRSAGDPVAIDRLGSVRARGNLKVDYFPWGEEKPSATQNDTDKFGTYYRDQATGLDYAMNRYYASTAGRFMSPDPYQSPDGAAVPVSWNRYAYSHGDPVNLVDLDGLNPMGACLAGLGRASQVGAGVSMMSCFNPYAVYANGAQVNTGSMLGTSGTGELWAGMASYAGYVTGVFGWTAGVNPVLAMQYNGLLDANRYGQNRDACHDRNLGVLKDLNIFIPGTPQFGPNGSLRWQVTEAQAAALRLSLGNVGANASQTTGAFHSGDVGTPNYDFRVPTQTNGRYAQIVIGPVANGVVQVYADTDLYLARGISGTLGHGVFEVLPGLMGFDVSCLGARP